MTHAHRSLSLVAVCAVLSGCGGGAHATPDSPQPRAPAPSRAAPSSPTAPADSVVWLSSDSTTRTALLSLEVTKPAGASSALLNGYRAGRAQVVVPLGWTVKWSWHNRDSTASHSLVVMVQREKIPLEGGRPAFSNAMTKAVTEGLGEGQSDNTTFEAEETGWYWLLCGVPSHAIDGEWIELRVDPDAKTAQVKIKPG